jgi:hypothetical protein
MTAASVVTENNMSIKAQDVLVDMIDRLKSDAMEASQRGIKNATTLALQAEELTRPVLKLPMSDMLDSLDSIKNGLAFGLAKIAEDEARDWFSNLINTALDFAASILRNPKF